MIGNKKILVVITARSGSKGVKGKNYKKLMEEPLFLWSVKAAQNSKYVDKIVISSNCKNCKKIYEEYKSLAEFFEEDFKVEWIQRPDKISGDLSKNEEALIHSLEYLKDKNFNIFDIVVNLQPTSPCRLSGLLDKCIKKYYNGGYDSLLTGVKFTPFFWQKKDGKWVYNVDKNDCCNRKMRQEFFEDEDNSEFLMHDCGNIFITDSRILLDTRCRIGYNPCIYEVSGLNGLQIDTEFDFELIENMAKVRKIESLI